MAENTKIEWATASFSPWIGCAKVHTGCDNCYAAAMAGRLGVTWGPSGTRRRTAESTWRKVETWNRQATGAAERPRVFPSLCDPFEDWDGHVDTPTAAVSMADVRRDFFALIDRCQNLDFLLLTKRPENIRRMWPDVYGRGNYHPAYVAAGEICGPDYTPEYRRGNCWLLYSASDQESLQAGLPHLLACRDLAPVLGLSLEPLIGPVNLEANRMGVRPWRDDPWLGGIDWVIVGGESGSRARPCDLAWIRSIITQCREAGVRCFVKQLGHRPVWKHAGGNASHPDYNPLGWREVVQQGTIGHHAGHLHFADAKGGDPDEWPEDLRVREFPLVTSN